MRYYWTLVLAFFVGTACAQTADLTVSLPRVGKLPGITKMHGSAVVGNRLYVIGGHVSPGGYSDQVISTEIRADGKLGGWRQEQKLPGLLHYLANSVEVVNNRIYVVAGLKAPSPFGSGGKNELLQVAHYTTVRADGSLEPWKRTEPFPGPGLICPAVCSTDRFLYVTGGQANKRPVDSVIVGEFQSDGSVGTWRQVGKLPIAVWFGHAAVVDERMYVWAGLTTFDNVGPVADAFSAEVLKNGDLGPWRKEAPLPTALYSAACCGFNDYLISVSGRYQNGYPTNGIWFTRLQDGRITKWRLIKTDLEACMFHSIAIDRPRGWVFVVGGRYRAGIDQTVFRDLDVIQAFKLPQEAPAASPAIAEKFQKIDAALAQAASQKKQVLAYFYSPQVPSCRRFIDNVLSKPEFAKLSEKYVLAGIDTSGTDASYSYKYSVFRVPGLAVLSPTGELVKRSIKTQTMEDVVEFLQ